MAINQTTKRSSSNSNSDATWWVNLEGIKKDTSVAFNLASAFKGATAEQVVKILNTQEVHISCYNKVSVKLRGQREDGSKFILGYLNNYAHGLDVDCDPKELSEVSYAIKAELENLTIADISKPITVDEATDILANL